MLIGIIGKLGVGKDYISHNVIEVVLKKYKSSYLQLAFADQIKINVMTKKNIQYQDVYIDKTQETRQLLQIEGTEEGRNSDLGPNIWINYLDNWIKVFENRGIENFIISDVRFKNELEYIKKNNGITIKIVAPNRNMKKLQSESNGDQDVLNKIRNHRSECDLDDIQNSEYDMIIYNDIDSNNNVNDYLLQFSKVYFKKTR
jgi:phosphomevalonate kinase